MATESIKAIASQMSPDTGQRLIESGITTTPREVLRDFTIPRKEKLFPDSLREQTSPHEASQEAWHSRNFPQDMAKMHYNIGCMNNPKENGMPCNKLANDDKAEDGSDATLLETKTNEVTQIGK